MSTTDTPPASDLSPTRAIIRLDHLRHNVRVLQERAGQADIMGVVKANAYGHGAVRIARVLREEGIRHFAVARVAEALELRAAGITDSLLVLGAPLPHHLPAYATHNLAVTVSSRDVADAVLVAADDHGPLRVHVKIDTGMGRIGVAPDEAVPVVRQLQQAQDVELVGLWTHFATAGQPDDAFFQSQLDRFRTVVQQAGHAARCIHAANSSALLHGSVRLSDDAPTLVRAGIALYGLATTPEVASHADLRPVMQLTSQVTHVKTVAPGTSISYGRRWYTDRRTRIATIGIGYGDGYARLLSNRAEVGLHGRRVPVVGSVCMDMAMVDVGPASSGPDVAVGDTVVLFGEGGPSAFEVAAWAETIPYEVCCHVAERVPRIYVEAPPSPNEDLWPRTSVL